MARFLVRYKSQENAQSGHSVTVSIEVMVKNTLYLKRSTIHTIELEQD